MKIKLSSGFLQKMVIFGVLLLIIIVLSFLSKSFLTVTNLNNVTRQVAFVVITGCAVTPLMISGNFDLSIGSVLGLTGMLSALFVTQSIPLWFSIILSTLVGSAIGLLNGLMVIKLRIPSIIATLGTMYAARGLALVISGGNSIHMGLGKNFTLLGRGYLGGIPIIFIIMFLTIFLFYFIESKTILGRYTFAIGGNKRTALLSGINVGSIIILLYFLVGTLTGFSGTLMASRLGVGQAMVGSGFEFDVIVAVVLGGTSIEGGEGSIFGMLIGAFIVGFIANGLNLMGIHSFYQSIVKGVVLVGAVLLDQKLKGRIAD
ncbi:MAG TPA: ABC transporter permease [Atribacter sp.]|jgi:ribose/xylose/arabinose/galactoside ABC-type transport system permease subunit|uniref:Ribose transport system permease protein RbsC n=1 Tax=Candidatus Atribacter allofermentans TaxID=1852833 RepID=A0A1V5SM76_9BACT|nr:ABC transporter permease [Atribacter sp.]MDI9595881.1 ABC transporter permease [Atribacterota bacterium]OQA55585.1 MAG: Ribose transport system permease protein RbsC [Candidatus Atribacteria bacterium ADurb.Bin276]HHT11300.1 ABC transporter permease [Candidatus Atribacteria bacterium]HOT05429.1 ABC transporter permease [Atribacter sp.]HQK84039.1 ABC transporter permease [Atribacter sp.]